jgi:hypothetical protein
MGQRKLEEAQAQWTRQQADPQLAALLASEEGKAGLRLAELGVAGLAREVQRPALVAHSGRLLHTDEPAGTA